MQTCCAVVELRQYTLRPGMRDVLIELFDREFVETQEAEGMAVIGQFRDLDDPDRFVWLRGFADMPTRARALTAFYGGPVWKAHRDAARATMVDTDDVLLLRPARPASGLPFDTADRPAAGATAVPATLLTASVCYFGAPVTAGFVERFASAMAPVLRDTGATVVGYYVTDASPNTYAPLPVREGENVFVWFSRFDDKTSYERHRAALAASARWRDEMSDLTTGRLKAPLQTLRLAPTSRSQLGT